MLKDFAIGVTHAQMLSSKKPLKDKEVHLPDGRHQADGATACLFLRGGRTGGLQVGQGQHPAQQQAADDQSHQAFDEDVHK